MLTIFYNKNIHVVINGIIFSFDEFKSIGEDEKDFLRNSYLEVFYSETQAYSKDENENQGGISEDLLIILNKISSKNESFYLQKRFEFDNPPITMDKQIQNKKDQLILKRKNTLNKNTYILARITRDSMLEIKISENPASDIMSFARKSADFCQSDKNIEDEIEEIEAATSLQELEQFE